MTIFERIRRFDAYAKTADDFRTQTFTGGVGTLYQPLTISDSGQRHSGRVAVSGRHCRLSTDSMAV